MGKNAPNNAGYPPESLERVSGIGPKTAEALAQIGVRNLADLARSAPEALATALFEQVGLRVSPERIEAMNWIGQAQALLQQNREEQAAQPLPAAVKQEPVEVPDVGNTVDKPQWRQYAGFSLFFDYGLGGEDRQGWQTRIYHEETGKEALFADTASQTWLDWILQQAQLPTDATPESIARIPPTSPRTITQRDASAAILDVEVGERAQGEVGGKKLVAEVRFNVVDPYGEALNVDSTPYQVLVLTIDQDRHQTRLVAADQGILPTKHADHRHDLEFPIPELGRYEVLTILVVQGQMELVADYRGPILKIVP